MNPQLLALMQLVLTPGLGSTTIKNLISYAGSAHKVLELSKSRLLKIPGVGHQTISLLRSNNQKERAIREVKTAIAKGVNLITYLSDQYPYRLKQALDSPPILYYKGNNAIKSEHPTIAIVGTRKATHYGKQLTEKIIEQLIPLNPIILSGLAYGIDIHAHRMALKYGLSTYAVLGSGVDVIYPAVHKNTALAMVREGGLISEQSFGSKPDAFNFPARNRIIAGMSDLVVVVEAAQKGGALITAEIANSYNREVAAFPGRVDDEYSAGCNRLIKSNKAHLVENAEDVLKLMNWEIENQAGIKRKILDMSSFNADERSVLNALYQNNNELPLELLSVYAQIPLNKLASILLQLELKGILKPLPGKTYKVL